MTTATVGKIPKAVWKNTWMGVSPHPALSPLREGNLTLSQGSSGKYFESWRWIEGRSIFVFREASVDQKTVPKVIEGITSLIERIGLNIEVVNFDAHESINPAMDYATTPEGEIDGELLGARLIEEPCRDLLQGGRPHADVLITDKPFTPGNEENWGYSEFSSGCMIISLHGGRQSGLEYIVNIAMHETGHLLGLPLHHDTLADKYHIRIEGYPEAKDCLMFWRASTRNICPRCADAIKYFWRGLQSVTSP